jgi:hypothetical protein
MKVLEVLLEDAQIMTLDRAITKATAADKVREIKSQVFQGGMYKWNDRVEVDASDIFRLGVIMAQPDWKKHLTKWVAQNKAIDKENAFTTFLYLHNEETGEEAEPDVVVHYAEDPDDPSVGYRGDGVEIESVQFAETFKFNGKMYPARGYLQDHPELNNFIDPDQEEKFRLDIIDRKREEAEMWS